MQLYHLWSHTIQLHCISHPEKSSQVFIWVFCGVTSKLMLLNHCNQCWLKLEIVCIYSRLSDCIILFLNNRPPEILHCVGNGGPSDCCPLFLCLVMSLIFHCCVFCFFLSFLSSLVFSPIQCLLESGQNLVSYCSLKLF